MGKTFVKISMGLFAMPTVFCLLLLASTVRPVWATDNVRLEELQRKIEAQQRLLEAQQAMLQELSKEMEALKKAGRENHNDAEQARRSSNDTDVNVFGKPFVTSADPRFKVNVSGMVNRQMVYADDGNKSKLYHTDSDNIMSRINVVAEGAVSEDLTVGARIETGIQDNRPLKVSQNNENSGFDFTSRWIEAYIASKRFGKLGIGKGFASSVYINETDLSGTQVVSLLSPGNLFGGLLFYDNDTNDYTGIRVSDLFVDIETLSIVNRLRYDSPQFWGFQLSGSTGSDQRNDVTLRWKNQIGDFQFSGASSYQKNSFGRLADWRVDGALSTLHKPSGLNLTGGAFKAKARDDGRHLHGFIVKGGWRRKFFDFGETALSADYVHNYDTSSDSENGTTYSAFLVQNIDRWGLELYGGYRYYDLDRQGLDTEAIHVPVVGTRKVF